MYKKSLRSVNSMQRYSKTKKVDVFSGTPCIVDTRWQRHVGSKTVHQQNPPVLNWRCSLTQVDMYNGHKMAVVPVVNLTTHYRRCLNSNVSDDASMNYLVTAL